MPSGSRAPRLNFIHSIPSSTNPNASTGIGPKITQSVLTAAFLFAFKDVLYEQTVRLRGRVARKALTP